MKMSMTGHKSDLLMLVIKNNNCVYFMMILFVELTKGIGLH